MTHRFYTPLVKKLLPFALTAAASAAQAQDADCRSDDYLEAAIAHLESHYRSFPEDLFSLQLYLKEGFGVADMKADGKWGPKTQTAVCGVLQTYTKIGGSEGDWGIHRANHTPAFTLWVLRAARSNLSDGEVEFPD